MSRSSLPVARGLAAQRFDDAVKALEKIAGGETLAPLGGELLPDSDEPIEKLASALERAAGRPGLAAGEGYSGMPDKLAEALEAQASELDQSQEVFEKAAMLLVGVEAQEEVLRNLRTAG